MCFLCACVASSNKSLSSSVREFIRSWNILCVSIKKKELGSAGSAQTCTGKLVFNGIVSKADKKKALGS